MVDVKKIKASPDQLRGALKFYKVSSFVTGTLLLLLCFEMLLKYVWGVEIFAFGPNGFLTLEPVMHVNGEDVSSVSSGVNISLWLLIIHGWGYVVYIFATFRIWSLMRWEIIHFLIILLGGVVPFLSFFTEAHYEKKVKAVIQELV